MSGNGMEITPAVRVLRRSGFTIAADGSYAACLAEAGVAGEGDTGEGGADSGGGVVSGWFVERWTLAGPEPYAVPLPGAQPEEAGTQLVPLPDGRVLIRRRVADRHDLALLYPTGPGTGELPIGSLRGDAVTLLPPSPLAGTAFALVHEAGDDGGADGEGEGDGVTSVWQVCGAGNDGPVPVLRVTGRCTGGVWLDRAGRLLALDRTLDGRTKAVAVDLHLGEASPLLQLTEDSDDRLVLAEPDSGLLLLRSDATGEARLGWGVLGSRRPVRFPDALQVPGVQLTPVAAQPGQILQPEAVVVALRAEVPGGAESLALWRPGERRPHWRASPPGWLGAAGFWGADDLLRLPCSVPEWPCGVAAYEAPRLGAGALPSSSGTSASPSSAGSSGAARVRTPKRRACRVLPLQQAPLGAAKAG
ncbi:hypothetical protein SAMN05216251_107209 [Actinacidiphila alni]|uniref:Uncharacterized protein n=1 Tax=Actinacidiphila alni TaxID=380248 RepID=A0A1I2F8Z6_9ACTN|nr:hypothetical protein [Actinacidiphila alni]SFF01208.1 hypothetical protein SAMN05216251_107209 [Actinacidiphila alni]